MEYKKIYIQDINTMGIIEVQLVQDLSEKQILVEHNGVYAVTNRRLIVSEENFIEYQESIYIDMLKDFKEYLKHKNIEKSLLARMIDDLAKDNVIEDNWINK